MPGLDHTRPRIVLVSRPTWLEELLARHGTMGQAAFYLESRGQSIDGLLAAHEQFAASYKLVLQALPPDRRRTQVKRDELDRFLFAPDDVVVIIGQDGLVPNAAKYLQGQMVIGINPDPERFEGVLCPHPPAAMENLIDWLDNGGAYFDIEKRVQALAVREDGQQLLALNEVFAGHASHQTARYLLKLGDQAERQFSSGVICSTGTGVSGWARSIILQRGIKRKPPAPADPRLIWFVREPWPSVYSSAELNFGLLAANQELELTSQMAQGGVVFADGIESDRLEFLEGQTVKIKVAPHRLNLVLPYRQLHPRKK